MELILNVAWIFTTIIARMLINAGGLGGGGGFCFFSCFL